MHIITKLFALLATIFPAALLAAVEGGDKLAPEPTVSLAWVYVFFFVFVGICVWIGIAIWKAERETRSRKKEESN